MTPVTIISPLHSFNMLLIRSTLIGTGLLAVVAYGSIKGELNATTSCSYEATCTVSGVEGVCVSIGSGCCSGTATSGLCPGSSDIQCCTNNACSTPQGSGTCKQTSACSGTSVAGYCTGPSEVQCCVDGTPGPEPTGACTYSCGTASASSYTTGTNGLNMITAFEGFSSTCYQDAVGVWTIGYGHACQDSSDDLPQYGVSCGAGYCSGSLTEPEGEEVLLTDLKYFESCVQGAVKVPITQNQFDSFVSFSYNNGCGGFQSSTLLSELNAGTLTDKEAQYQFTRWHSSCLAGLERRRFAESLLFSSCDTNFGCTHDDCAISYHYPECTSNCQYCSACGGCSGDTYTLSTCVNP